MKIKFKNPKLQFILYQISKVQNCIYMYLLYTRIINCVEIACFYPDCVRFKINDLIRLGV